MFDDLLKNRQSPEGNKRSINSIIEESQNNASNEYSGQKFSTSNGPQMSSGGNKERANPLWVYEDQSTLPAFSQGKKVTDSFDSYRNILENNTIPEHIKIQLLHFLKDKYDKVRLSQDFFDESEDDDRNYDENNKILRSILDRMSVEKRMKAMNIASIFLKIQKS